MTDLDQRTAHLARALFADLDYVLGVDPNTLAAFCVRVLDEWDADNRNDFTICGRRNGKSSRRPPPIDPDDSEYIVKGG
jgi:hypothetical protein